MAGGRLSPPHKAALGDLYPLPHRGTSIITRWHQRVNLQKYKIINEKHKKVVDKCKILWYDKSIKSKEEPTDG